jgi:hypothetical protein
VIKVAIVGPSQEKWTVEQAKKANAVIYDTLLIYKLKDPNTVLVSGHCPKGGIDIWAELQANKIGVYNPDYIFKPEVNQWNDGIEPDEKLDGTILGHTLMGYKSRNIKIAKTCDILYCVVPNKKFHHIEADVDLITDYCNYCDEDGHPTNGGCWTMKYAKKLGKETHLVVIE